MQPAPKRLVPFAAVVFLAARLPAVLAFCLLAIQVAVPWTAPHYLTQDGPSHLYNAVVMRDLLLHRSTSPYSPFYTLQRVAVPNWTGTIVFALAATVAGEAHAEQLVTSLAVLLGFFGFCYAIRSLDPTSPPWTPVACMVFQSWFLYIGFYNFYLGMALVPLVLGYYLRRAKAIRPVQALVLSLALLAVYLTHLIPAAICAVALLCIALFQRNRRQFALVAAACIPVVILGQLYVHDSPATLRFEPAIASAWKSFPMHVFHITPTFFGAQTASRMLLLALIVAAVVLLRKSEWQSVHGGLVVATLLTAAAYFLVPDGGLGGSGAKIRFSWAIFVLGALLPMSVSRLRRIRAPIALCFAILMAGNLAGSIRPVKAISNLASAYLKTAEAIERGSTFVRLRYAAPTAPAHYGYDRLARDPFIHLDALAAAEQRMVDLSDYEAASRVFPVIFQDQRVESGVQYALWGFESPDLGTPSHLHWVNANLPAPLRYVVVSGDPSASRAIVQGMPEMLRILDQDMDRIAISPDGFTRIYRRR
jgi:hypothetical protein